MALPFITMDESSGRFSINEDSLAVLRALPSPLAVVAIAGVYRTGKSFLLNSLAASGSAVAAAPAPASALTTGFTVGGTVRACTKGLWLYPRTLKLEGGEGTVIFLDCEGLGSTNRSETYDVRLFSLALLLSSVFLYNSNGVIDSSAISKLGLVAHLTQHIQARAGSGAASSTGGASEFASFFPAFVWCLRDFSVKLERDGRKVSPNEYLEAALSPEDSLSEEAASKNATRAMLRAYFSDRECVPLPRPCADEAQLQALPTLPPEALRPEFRAALDALRRKVIHMCSTKPKCLFGKALTGALLAALASEYVDALNSGAAPIVASAWERVVTSSLASAIATGAEAYSKAFAAAAAAASAAAAAGAAGAGAAAAAASGATGAGIIIDDDAALEAHTAAEAAAEASFTAAAVKDADRVPPALLRLRATCAREFASFRAANEAASAAHCSRVLAELCDKHLRSLVPLPEAALPPASGAGVDAAARAATAVGRTAPTSVALARAHRDACVALVTSYHAVARGPARYRTLVAGLTSRGSDALEAGAGAVDAGMAAHVSALQVWGGELGTALAASRGREAAAMQELATVRRDSEATLGEATRNGAETAERLRSTLAAREGELSRLGERFDRAAATAAAAVERSDEANARAAAELAAARARVEEALAARGDHLLQAAAISQRLAAAEAARGVAERAAAEAAARTATDATAALLLTERVRAADNECVRLREQTELLFEANASVKALLESERKAREEAELREAVVKARAAQLEGDKGDAQSQANQLEALACSLKLLLAKSGKRVVLPERLLQRLYDNLS